MDHAAWPTQQLAEFVTLAASFQSEDEAALGTVERAAEALDAEVAAMIVRGEVVTAVGFAEGAVPVTELVEVAAGRKALLTVPGAGERVATVEPLQHVASAALVVARSTDEPLSGAERGVLRGIARVAAMTMRMLFLLREERERSSLLAALVEEQTALRRVAWLVASGVEKEAVCQAVADEVRTLAEAELTQILRYEGSLAVPLAVAGKARIGLELPERYTIGGYNVLTLVQQTGLPARIDDAADVTGFAARVWKTLGLRSVVGSPVLVHGQVWGAILVSASGPDPIPAETEQRIAGFTELVATAIFNAHAHAELTASRARIVSASDATRRRIERDLHDGIQQRLVTVAMQVRGALVAGQDWPSDARANLTNTERSLEELLEEVREISRGLHPTILSEAGLGPALKALARRSATPAELDVRVRARLAPSVEVAAYYVVSEALTNVAKHAHASVARVTVTEQERSLLIEVCDDGVGGADPARGSGLIGLTDRVAALGGTISIRSPRAGGTTMIVELPTPGGSVGPERADASRLPAATRDAAER